MLNKVKTKLLHIKKYINPNTRILNSNRKIEKNKVNLHWWSMEREDKYENVGDYLSYVVCNYMLEKKRLSFHDSVEKTQHLYAIGSIIQGGMQNAVIWGSGLKHGERDISYFMKKIRKLDIRLVRGPETRAVLLNNGFQCPECYGDPAILMPLIYMPKIEKTEEYLVILHFSTQHMYKNAIVPVCKGYENFINRICSAKLVISSSLHGIILAESYGIPAILLQDKVTEDIFKYKDYYYSTGRKKFPIAKTVEEALAMPIPEVPNLSKLRNNILNSFPYDMWEVY